MANAQLAQAEERRPQINNIVNPVKTHIRRIIQSALLGIALCFAQAGIAARNEGKPLKVLASFYPMYVMTLNVVGDTPNVSVECMTEPITGCLHDYQLTPANLKILAVSDVFIANGAGMETFIEKAVKQTPHNIAGNARQYVLYSMGIALFSGVAGLIASYYANTATGASIVLVAMGCYLLTLGIKLLNSGQQKPSA